MKRARDNGYTLIELSVVLVIIGLIVGGIIVGQYVVEGAKIRSQLSQIDKYKMAVNTFQTKYGVLPGDATPAQAAQFGFASRTGGLGNGNNDRHIRWLNWDPVNHCASMPTLSGEVVLFWSDLSSANLIQESFTSNADSPVTGSTTGAPPLDFSKYVPLAKIGHGGFLFAFDNMSCGIGAGGIPNYSGLAFEIAQPQQATNATVNVAPTFTISGAFAIDIKIDDGMPFSGSVMSASPGMAGNVAGSLGWRDNGMLTSPGYCTSRQFNYNVRVGGNGLSCNLMFAVEQ